MAIFQWERSCNFVVYGVITLYWIVISSKMPYVCGLKCHPRCVLLGSSLSCLIPKTFELWYGYSQQHKKKFRNYVIVTLAGTQLLQWAERWVLCCRRSKELKGSGTRHEKEGRVSTARFWALLLEVQQRPACCLENEETLLPACTFTSSTQVWGIPAVDSCLRCFGLRSCPWQQVGSQFHFPCLTVISSQRAD